MRISHQDFDSFFQSFKEHTLSLLIGRKVSSSHNFRFMRSCFLDIGRLSICKSIGWFLHLAKAVAQKLKWIGQVAELEESLQLTEKK